MSSSPSPSSEDAERLRAHRLQMAFCFCARLGLAARDHDLCTGGRIALGERAADSARAAGDDHHATTHVEQLGELCLVHDLLLQVGADARGMLMRNQAACV